MAETSDRDKVTINLNIISPTVPPHSFTNLPISTLISELKTKIHDCSVAHPPPSTQRLIYRGHHLPDTRSLKDVFGQDVVNSSEHLTLHLVTPALHNHVNAPSFPQPAQATISQAQPAMQPPPPLPHPMPQVHQMTFSAFVNGHPVQVHNSRHHVPNAATEQNGRQPDSQPAPQHEAHAVPPQPTELRPQIPSPANQQPFAPGQPGQLSPAQMQQYMNAVQNQAQSLLASQIAMMQQHPAFAGQLPVTVPTQGPWQPIATNPQGTAPAQPSVNPASSFSLPQALNGAVPAGQRGHAPQNPSAFVHAPAQRQVNTHQVAEPTTFPLNRAPRLQQQPSMSPPGQHVPQRNLYPDTPSTQTPPNRQTQTQFPSQAAPRSQSSAVYILSSPAGPQALLVSPHGQFTSSWLPAPPPHAIAPSAGPSLQQPLHMNERSRSSEASLHPSSSTTNNAPHGSSQTRTQMAQQPFNAPNPNAQPPAPNPNPQPREMNRLLAQALPHAWLLVRLFGFIWFFSHGASFTRTLLLCSAATIVFVAQLGLFRGLLAEARQRAEDLFQLRRPENHRGPERRHQGPHRPQGPGAALIPEPAAQHQVQQRTPQEGNVLRQSMRRAERGAALFLASLAPGVAERHIQATEEAARQRETREREERERMDREAAQAGPQMQEQSSQPSEGNTDNTRAVEDRQEQLVQV